MLKDTMNKKTLAIFVAIILFLCIIGIIIFACIPKSDVIEYEIYYDGAMGQGIIFRDEILYDLDEYEKVYYENVVDGKKVLKDTVIATAYKKGYIKATLEKLLETEENIVTYQNQNVITDFDDKKIQQYDFEIEVAIKQMSECTDGYIELHNTLCNLMTSRQEYIRLTYNTESNIYLQGLYTDELTMMESLRAWCDKLTAPFEGYLGFYCDGHEKNFTTENAQIFSYDDFKDAIDNEFLNENDGFKIVEDNKWYVLVEVEDSSTFQIGNYYPVYIGNEKQNEAGYLENVIESKKGCVLVFSFVDNVEKYLDFRKMEVFVGNRIEGFCVASDYIKNGVAVVKNNKSKVNISVNVLYENDEITIFDVTNELTLGQKVYK